jgi:hypothetical protein
MKRFLLFALVASSLLMAAPAKAQVNDTYVIPAVANAAGAYGTRWMTQFSVFNPQLDWPLRVTVVFMATNGLGSWETSFTVPANSVAYSDNILDDLFERSGTGSLLVATFPEDQVSGVPNDVVSRSFLLTSSTYNNSSAGTFGQTIPGVWAGLQDYATDGISAVAHGIRNIDRLGWRTNVGAVNLGRTSVVMRVNVYDADGRTILKNTPFTIPPYGHVQDRLPVQLDRGSVEFFVDDSSRDAVVFPYTSTIDQYSGDPTYQSPTLLAGPGILYGKGATIAPMMNPGKKINIETARKASEAAQKLGEVSLTRTEQGLKIGR